MRARLIVAATALLAGCAGPQPMDTANGQPVALRWSCPKEGTVVYTEHIASDGTKSTYSRTYAGADENPDVCRTASGSRYLFDLWNLATFRVTPEEEKQLRGKMSAFMHGKSDNAAFIIRDSPGKVGTGIGTGGQQHSVFYRVAGMDRINIDGNSLATIRLIRDSVNGSNSRQQSGEVWYDTASNVEVKSEFHPSSQAPEFNRVTKLFTPVTLSQKLLDDYTGDYRSKSTGLAMAVKRVDGHLVVTTGSESTRSEYPHNENDFYYADHGLNIDSFINNRDGIATQVIHHAEGKPDEVYDRVKANMAQN